MLKSLNAAQSPHTGGWKGQICYVVIFCCLDVNSVSIFSPSPLLLNFCEDHLHALVENIESGKNVTCGRSFGSFGRVLGFLGGALANKLTTHSHLRLCTVQTFSHHSHLRLCARRQLSGLRPILARDCANKCKTIYFATFSSHRPKKTKVH